MPASKNTAAAKDRRKSGPAAASTPPTGASSPISKNGNSLIVRLQADPRKLRAVWPELGSAKDDAASDVAANAESPAPSATLQADSNSNGVDASDSNSNTPAAVTTPGPASQSSMGPPADGPKTKKGTKRSAAAAGLNGEPKARAKPGPKKKQKTEDGAAESGRANGTAAHKLGPRANMGAINAGLRALDRSGTPCRKWARGNFKLKTFTGVTWEISRWTAPPKPKPSEAASTSDSTVVSAEGSNKENNAKDTPSHIKSESNSVVNGSVVNGGTVNGLQDLEVPSAAPSIAPSPAPAAVAAA